MLNDYSIAKSLKKIADEIHESNVIAKQMLDISKESNVIAKQTLDTSEELMNIQKQQDKIVNMFWLNNLGCDNTDEIVKNIKDLLNREKEK